MTETLTTDQKAILRLLETVQGIPTDHIAALVVGLDQLSKQRVQRERERCERIAAQDADLGRADLGTPEIEAAVGARILAAERIAWQIAHPEYDVTLIRPRRPHVAHQTSETQVWADVDNGVLDIVEALNTIWTVRTYSSCQGTIGEEGAEPYEAYVTVSWGTDMAREEIERRYRLVVEGENHGTVYRRAT